MGSGPGSQLPVPRGGLFCAQQCRRPTSSAGPAHSLPRPPAGSLLQSGVRTLHRDAACAHACVWSNAIR